MSTLKQDYVPQPARVCRSAISSGSRAFSSESPKIVMAQQLLRLSAISEATNEEALKAAMAAPLATIDPANLPAELSDYGPMLTLGSMKASDKFVPDPTAWQNMSFADLAAFELKRSETWPFIFGFACVGVGLTIFQFSLGKEGRKESRYIQMQEGHMSAH